MTHKVHWKQLAVCVAIPLAAGGLSALLTRGSMSLFERLHQPPLAPPEWLFPIVWTVLFILMGVACYLTLLVGASDGARKQVLLPYGFQLAFNFLWPVLFFNFRWYLPALIWLAALWALILFTAVRFFRLRKAAGLLLAPYLLWVAFAGYLNFGIYLLNP